RSSESAPRGSFSEHLPGVVKADEEGGKIAGHDYDPDGTTGMFLDMSTNSSSGRCLGRLRNRDWAAFLLCAFCVSVHAADQRVTAPQRPSDKQTNTFSKSANQALANQEGRMSLGEDLSRTMTASLAEAKAAHERRDYLRERQLLEPLAKDGNAEAQAMLGFLYRFGLGVPEDHAEAVNWFHKAAAQGNAWAQQSYGAALLRGDGIVQDIAQGIAWLQKAGDNGFVSAYATLGDLYLHGKGVARDREKGLAYYSMAADGGDMNASFVLGSMYEQGIEVERDLPKAVFWYRKGAELGFFMCQYNLARMYTSGVGVPQDLVEAYKWAVLAANSGPPDATTLRDFLKPKLSVAQLAKAERLASDWQATHQSRKWRQL
ncbi:tetratricopeptide repeat protein, partial [Burkholderia sp. L27(2015)]|uniref:tetratricopeptide repeat protein n=1 Tax=Burkholderia sp. L27(2015) TaxID=1641858 RepID=UPI001C20A80D